MQQQVSKKNNNIFSVFTDRKQLNQRGMAVRSDLEAELRLRPQPVSWWRDGALDRLKGTLSSEDGNHLRGVLRVLIYLKKRKKKQMDDIIRTGLADSRPPNDPVMSKVLLLSLRSH